MKKLIARIKALPGDRRGETLIETLASVVVFVLLMVSVTLMISASLRISRSSTEDAAAVQGRVNTVVLSSSVPNANLILDDSISTIEIPVNVSNSGEFMSFSPEEASP